MADSSKDKKPSLDNAPAPPEMRIRKGLSNVVASRDAEVNGTGGPTGTMPGLGGPNAIGAKAMAAEQAIGDLANLLPDPSGLAPIIGQLRAVVIQAIQTTGGPPPAPQGMGLAGIVSPPAAVAPPAMAGMGMPAPPLM